MAGKASQQSTVIEFTCLWTVNKTQKQKKWQDGTLRFHPFNRRAMLYDDFPRLIDNIFLPHIKEISPGDELEFDRHLVSVEDLKGTVIQDLTPIYERQNSRTQAVQASPSNPVPVRGARGPVQSHMYASPLRTATVQSQTSRLPSHAIGSSNSAERNSPQASRLSRTPLSSNQSATQVLQPISRQFVPPSRRSEVNPQSDLTDIPTSSLQEIPAFPRRQMANAGTALAPPTRIPHAAIQPIPSDPVPPLPSLVQQRSVPPPHMVAVSPAPAPQPPPPPVFHKPRPIVLSLPKDDSQTKTVFRSDDEIVNAWTPQESEDLYGDWRPPAISARLSNSHQ